MAPMRVEVLRAELDIRWLLFACAELIVTLLDS
jgi:hypothetical protein